MDTFLTVVVAAAAALAPFAMSAIVARNRRRKLQGERERGGRDARREIADNGVGAAFSSLRHMSRYGLRSEAYRQGYSEAVMRAQLGADYIRRKA